MPRSITARSYGGLFGSAFRIESRTTVPASSTATSSSVGVHTYEVIEYPRQHTALNVQAFIAPVLDPPTQINYISWYAQTILPVKLRRELAAAEKPVTAYLDQNPETANFESKWHQPWSEPIRISLKHGLRAQFQPFYTAPVRYLPTPNVTLTMSVNDVAADAADIGVFVGHDPLIDKTDVDVSVAEVQSQRGGNASIGEDSF